MHPVSKRRGSAPNDRLFFIQVRPHQMLRLTQWPERLYDFMPLPNVISDDITTHSLRAYFRNIVSVDSSILELSKHNDYSQGHYVLTAALYAQSDRYNGRYGSLISANTTDPG